VADYFSHTVIQQIIPTADITPLERILLGEVFHADGVEDGIYLSADDGPKDLLQFDTAQLRGAYWASEAADGTALAKVREALEAAAPSARSVIEIDISTGWWDGVLQDIVRRSATLDHISVIMTFTCSAMLPDGFGGLAMLITKDAIRCQSLEDIMFAFQAEAEDKGEITPIG
jgi:hypothetical protein